ncbi:heparinase [Agrobacterium tumefaciens]|uniref:Heparinase n=1 Tax=Agrobacterium tumefaciens TaxID=358 RepID=A0AAP9J7Y3_AGRTU|nr:heparinase II/III family protein [Agrobacterium tumefaciens]NSZ59909.1 heparinase [Agrobacterium tumefaciens]QDY96335.1 heparinase [Agrobacterium tumefaciens]UXS46582.1 heparinase [Agrobacterium tumefaciens]UXS72835.1 heparinase [Agrobacterium tumefaciens]UXS80330.1 heparinase [Agrobacterium tumefaciens]
MFVEMMRLLPKRLADFGVELTVEKIRSSAPDTVCRSLVEAAEKALGEPWSVILAGDYREYSRTGNRDRFEALYFSRRLKLNALVLGECAEGQGRFLDAIIDGLWLICEESGWQLPAHNSHIRGGPRDPLPDPQNPVIDLFAAETGANLAVCLHLLAPELERANTNLVSRVRAGIDQRITKPYLARHFWWMGNGDERMNNWTAWITQNVLLSTMLSPTDQPTRRSVVEKALKSLDAFQKDYAEDGACEEGVLYYGHAALCMFGAMSILETSAPGSMAPLFHAPKLRNMAEFIVNMHVAGDKFFNFADARAKIETSGVREYLFGKAVSSPSLQTFATACWNRSPDRLMHKEWNLWYRVQAVLATQELSALTAADPAKTDIVYPGIGLAIARDGVFDLAVKAGNNGESHNHNDVGSFTLYKNGRPFIIDVGVETYTAKTFSPQRYDIWTMQSAFHNLPTFGGVMQVAGAEFAAADFVTRFSEEEAEFSLDMAGAYPSVAGVEHYRRRVRLLRGSHVEVVDDYLGGREAVLSLMVAEKPALMPGGLVFAGLGEIACEGAGEPVIEAITINDARLRQSWPPEIYRVLIPIKAGRLCLTIS